MCDASDFALEVVLSQKILKVPHVFAYASNNNGERVVSYHLFFGQVQALFVEIKNSHT